MWVSIGEPGYSMGVVKNIRQVRAGFYCRGTDDIDSASWTSVHLRLVSENLVLNRGPLVTRKTIVVEGCIAVCVNF